MTIEVGILIGFVGVILTLLTFNLNRDKSVKNEASRNAVIETKLDNIGQSVDSIRIDLRANEQRWNSVSDRVARVEESTKSLHKRIDSLEKEVN